MRSGLRTSTVLLTFLTALCCAAQTSAAPEPATTIATLARPAVEAALQQAGRESKKLFLVSGFPACSWCKLFDRYHAAPEVKSVLDRYYVVVKIDTENMSDGIAVFEKYSKVGAPAWVVVAPDGKVLIDSYAGGSNVGFPYKPDEVAHYLKAVKATSPLTPEEAETLKAALEKTAASRRQSSAASPAPAAAPVSFPSR